jgi:hypothetical protein
VLRRGGVRSRSTNRVYFRALWKCTERETEEIIRPFLTHRLSFPQCIAALDAALAGLVQTVTGEQVLRLRIVMLANNEIVMKEMERRGSPG